MFGKGKIALLRYGVETVMKKDFKSVPIEGAVHRALAQEKLDTGRDVYVIIRDLWNEHQRNKGAGAIPVDAPNYPRASRAWHEKLAEIIASGNTVAIKAAQSALDLAWKFAQEARVQRE